MLLTERTDDLAAQMSTVIVKEGGKEYTASLVFAVEDTREKNCSICL